ncbi:TMV resistance protein N-like isoform X1 [Castanea sativa]|uniref:TMV resistance protein N-like isoform X1 n=2 Tax=Castanea sativa TaxID=21020 RepID=UPI003F64BEA5
MLPPLLLLCFFFTATAAAALLFLRRPAVATGSSSSPLRLLLLLLLRRCCCWFTMTVIDINLYYGGLLNNANANKGLPFEGPGIKCYYAQIDHKLKTLNDLKMIVMKKLCVSPALHDIQITFRSPHEVLKHQINYKYMTLEVDEHVKIMFDKMERIAQVSAIELYIKLELRAEVGTEEIQQTTTSLQVTIPDAQNDCGETDAENAISVQNIMNTIPTYTFPALSFSANTRVNMERRIIVQIPSMASLNNEGASFSSSTRRWEYAVFLSFRGEDTREGFTSHLYKALCNKGINTFIDDIDLPRGEEISEKLIQAIKKSSILVIVFSENYAESKWCLDELAEIIKCREKDQEVQIRPIFYNVDPSEIRNQNGNFGIALANHEKKFKNNKDKVQRWRDALEKAAKASGWHYKKGNATYKSESQFIQNIVEEISNAKLNWMPLYVAEYPVGINSRGHRVTFRYWLDEVCMVGMYGLPGVGKTTIAKAVYNKIAKHFDGSSFVENVRENLGTNAGIIKQKKQLLNDISRDGKWKVGNSSKGITLIEETLCCKKVLLILDDVDDSTPIKNLLGKCNWFAPGSRAIITLRDRHLLIVLKENVCTTYKVKEFEVEQLNKHEALQLFKEHAFPRNNPHDEDYSKLATKFIDFANGLPLALEIIARDLCGRAKDEWESALEKYKKIPIKRIQNILQVSYNELQDTEKDIFLDIACFFKGRDKDYVVKILDACELYPGSGIPRLINKCLITVDRCGTLSMHNLIQQMGKEVVRQQAPDILEKRSRLCCYKDSLEVLTGNKGSKKIRGIMLHSPQSIKVQLHTEAFRRMENLKFLIVENVHICKPLEFLPNKLILLKWPYYPFHWPSKYFPEQLVALEMPHSRIRLPKLIKQERRLVNLIAINLSGCEFITKLPKLWAPNLEDLDLSSCQNLVEIDEYFGSHEKLEFWNLIDCRNLQILPSQLRLKSLVSFYLSGCSRLEKLPDFHPEMDCLETLDLENSGIREVPSSIEHLTKLEDLNLYDCKNLRDLPDSIYKLQQLLYLWTPTAKLRPTWNPFNGSSGYGFVNLTDLELSDKEGMIELDLLMKPDYFPALERIDLSRTNIVTIPEIISKFPRLEELDIRDCKLLREIQGLPQSIRRVYAKNCMLLDTQSPSGLLNQVIEIIGILPSRVCGRARSNKLMDPQLTNYFPSETEGAESEDGDISMDPQFSNHFPSETGDISRSISCWGTEMPKWFNHQSVDNSIFFFVGRKFPKLVVCIVAREGVDGEERFSGIVDISINGYKNRENKYYSWPHRSKNTLFLFSRTQQSLQRLLNESNPTYQNLVEVSIRFKTFYSIKRWGVHVECTCTPHEDYPDDYGDSLMHLFGIL